jgi:hypothetical protein
MMLTVTQDGDAIFASAIEIASPQEREAFIAQACGADVVLRRQIEERVAAHLHARNGSARPKAEATNGAAASQHHAAPVQHHEPLATEKHATQAQPSRSSSLLMRSLAVAMLAALAAGIGLSYWAMHARDEAEKATKQLAEERESVRKSEEDIEHQREEADKARQAMAKDRDQAVGQERAAQSATQDMKAVMDFWQRRVLSVDRPVGWTGQLSKNVTLRQAVDTAETRIAEAFTERPLAEAALREIFASTYQDLQEPALAVRQYERALALREALQGESHADTMACRNELANAYRLADRPDDAGRLYDPNRESLAHAAALAIRGERLLAQKQFAEAEKTLRECLSIRQKIQPDDWTTFEVKSLLGEALLRQNKPSEAEPLLQSGYEGLKARVAKIPTTEKPRLTRALERLVRLYEEGGNKEKAVKLRKELDEALGAKPA